MRAWILAQNLPPALSPALSPAKEAELISLARHAPCGER